MRILNLLLNGITGLAASVFVAYFGVRNGTGLFTSLPDNVAEMFIRHDGLQIVALGIVVAALIAKVPVVKALKREKEEKHG